VRKPAEAEQYRIQALAQAKKFQLLTEAEGQSAALQSVGEGEAAATKVKGLAQADVIQAQGFAEAEAMTKKAAAWQGYNEAAIIQNLVDKMPAIAEAISKPLQTIGVGQSAARRRAAACMTQASRGTILRATCCASGSSTASRSWCGAPSSA